MNKENCLICGCGPLTESDNLGWYDCPGCGEIFAYNAEGSLEPVKLEEWKHKIMA